MQEFKIGARVRPSAEGVSFTKGLNGTVIGVPEEDLRSIKWDNLRQPQTLHVSYLEDSFISPPKLEALFSAASPTPWRLRDGQDSCGGLYREIIAADGSEVFGGEGWISDEDAALILTIVNRFHLSRLGIEERKG